MNETSGETLNKIIVSLREFRDNSKKYLDAVENEGSKVYLKRHGIIVAVIKRARIKQI